MGVSMKDWVGCTQSMAHSTPLGHQSQGHSVQVLALPRGAQRHERCNEWQ
jgi:hypothetical protein